jgi:predicted transposase YbfD/YdcC
LQEHTTIDQGHARRDTRRCVVTHDLSAMSDAVRELWPAMRSAIMIESTREILSGKNKGQASTERRYYISSATLEAEEFNRRIRAHWQIENQCHWLLDVDGAVEKAKLDEARTHTTAVSKERDEVLKRFEGIDPEEARALLAEKQKREEEKLLKGGDDAAASEEAQRQERERIEAGEKPRKTEVIFVQFREAVESARAKAEVRHVANIAKSANDGVWQASAWYLERSYPQKWGRLNRTEISGPDGGPIEARIDLDALDDKLTALLGLED